MPSFQLVDYGFFAFGGVGEEWFWLCVFRGGCKASYSLNDLWEGIFPGFRLISNRLDFFDTCIHWLIGIGSEREEAVLLLCIVGLETFYFCHV